VTDGHLKGARIYTCLTDGIESLETIVTDDALLARFLAAEEVTAAMYGRWAPSRETLFRVRRRA
jgi:hypothetical protein